MTNKPADDTLDEILYAFSNYWGRHKVEGLPRLNPTEAKAKLLAWKQQAETVNRFEVIDYTKTGTGRDFTKWEKDDFNVEVSMQDDGRTMKVFLSELRKEQHD